MPIPDVPIASPQIYRCTMSSGRNAPLLMTCEYTANNGAIKLDEYVIKLFGDPGLSKGHLARELFTSSLASVLGLSTPLSTIIRIDEHTSFPGIDTAITERINKSRGLNYGSKFMPGMKIFRSILDDHLQDATDIFAFDMLAQNMDRRKDNPNILWGKEGFILIDHEMAFPCATPIQWLGKFPEPWEVNQFSPKNHALFSYLRNKPVSFDAFICKLQLVSDKVLDAITSTIPGDWRSVEIGLICQHIGKARDNAITFKRALQEALV